MATEILQRGVLIAPEITKYKIQDLTVTVNGNPAELTYTGDYDANEGDTIQISGTLENGSAINYGAVNLKLPVVRYADDMPTTKEIYFNSTVVNGVLTATGSFPTGGHWSFNIDRINRAIDRAGNGWHLDHQDVKFLI